MILFPFPNSTKTGILFGFVYPLTGLASGIALLVVEPIPGSKYPLLIDNDSDGNFSKSNTAWLCSLLAGINPLGPKVASLVPFISNFQPALFSWLRLSEYFVASASIGIPGWAILRSWFTYVPTPIL